MAVTYTVQNGDTLGRIAALFNTTVERLVELNSLVNPNIIDVGQVLLIEVQGPDATPVKATGGSFETESGSPVMSGCQAGVNLLRNPGFQSWDDQFEPRGWPADNVIRTTISHSGNYAAELGRNPNKSAELFQDVPVTPRRVYRVSFWGREIGGRNTGNFNLRTTVVYYDRNGDVIGQSDPDYNEDAIPNNYYSQYSFSTGEIPGNTRTARVRFRFSPGRSNQNSVAVDDVFFECIF